MKSYFKLFKSKYFFIKPKILKAYIKLSLKIFNSLLEEFINFGDIDSYHLIDLHFQAGLSNGSITKEYAYYCTLLKEYEFFFKYKRKFERLDKKLFKLN